MNLQVNKGLYDILRNGYSKPAKSLQSCPSKTLQTVAYQGPLSMGFFRQEYWSGLPCPPPGDLPDPGIEPVSLMSPTLAGGFFTTRATLEAHPDLCKILI